MFKIEHRIATEFYINFELTIRPRIYVVFRLSLKLFIFLIAIIYVCSE